MYHRPVPFQLDPFLVALLAVVCAAPVVAVGLMVRASRRAVRARSLDA
jgi:hypothetical protein